MNKPMTKIDKIRTLMVAQTHDTAWLWDVVVALGIDMMVLADPGWVRLFKERNWGKIEEIKDNGKDIIVWHRPDYAPPSANVSELPKAIKILIFALAGELIKELHKRKKESYVEVGQKSSLGDWKNVEIFFNGKPVQMVRSADAIFGIVNVLYKDKLTGKPVLEGDNLKTLKLSGKVDIVVKDKPQGFF